MLGNQRLHDKDYKDVLCRYRYCKEFLPQGHFLAMLTAHVVSVIDDNEAKAINKPFRINNDNKGFEKLLTILDSVTLDKDDFLIGIEATGIYGENLLEFLKSKGYSVKLLNPFQTSRYREQITMKKS